YDDLRGVLSNATKKGQPLDAAVEDWFASRMYSQDPEFRRLVEATWKSLDQMGIFGQDKVLLMDTGFVGTMPWFVYAVIRFYDQEFERPRRDVQVMRVKRQNSTRQVSEDAIAEDDRDLFNEHSSLMDMIAQNDSMLSILEGLGDKRFHPIRFSKSQEMIVAETPEHRLQFF